MLLILDTRSIRNDTRNTGESSGKQRQSHLRLPVPIVALRIRIDNHIGHPTGRRLSNHTPDC